MAIRLRVPLLVLAASSLLNTVPAAQARDAQLVYGVDAREAEENADDKTWLTDYRDLSEAGASVNALRVRRKQPIAPTPTPPPSSNTGAGVLVAVVDTGIFLTHSEFAGRIDAGGTCFGGTTACPGTSAQGNDNHGHGTHVAGIIAAAAGTGTTGVAPGASLLAVKVLDANGSGTYTAVGQGISYAATKGARVINMSLGGSSASTTLLAPLQQAATAGSVIVAAAGNSGNAFAPGYPAAYATQAGIVGSMLIVGSVKSTNVISSFSQTPGNGGCVASGGATTCFKDVFLVAPGENILSTYLGGGYATMSGTSMATPYVSGVAARVIGASPFLTNKQVVGILLQSATDLGAVGVDGIYGHGLVNLSAALAPLGTTSIATSGVSTSGFGGTGPVGGSSISGPLGAALCNSTVAKSLVFFDAYGRDYATNLSAAVGRSAVSLANVIAQSGSAPRYVSALGNGYSVSGFVADEMANSVAVASFTDRAAPELSNVVIKARFTDNSSVMIGHNASLAGNFNQLDLASNPATAGLFMSASAMNSPFLGLTNDANFVAASFNSSNDLTFSFGHAASESPETAVYNTDVMASDRLLSSLTQTATHQRSAQNSVAAMDWKFAPWGVAGVNAAYTQEENSLLGTSEQGALALTAAAATTSVGAGVRFDLGEDFLLSGSWSRGKTTASPVAGSLFQSFSDIESQAYGIALSKTGIFSDTDSLGIAVSRPLHITGGTAVMRASTGVTEDREIVYSTEVLNLASSTPETDYEIGYTARLDDGVTLQTNVMFQQNAGGEAGVNAVAGLVTLKANW